MSAVATSQAVRPGQRKMKILAGVLAVVCLVQMLLVVEEARTVQLWSAIRDDGFGGAARLLDGATKSASEGLASAVRTVSGPPPLTAAPEDIPLTGTFQTVQASPDAGPVETLVFEGATIRLPTGEELTTRPLRIAAGGDVVLNDGRTFAQWLDAAPDAQIELREVVAPPRRAAVETQICGGVATGVLAILHRRDQVDMLAFRAGTVIGPEAPTSALCRQWTVRAG